MDTIQPVKKGWATILLILNIFFPGVGTLLNAIMGSGIKVTGLMIGGLQLLLSAGLIGWLWSIYWGVLMYEKASGKGMHTGRMPGMETKKVK